MNYSNSQFNQLGAAAATLSRFPKRTRIYKEPPLCRYNSFSSSSSFLLDGRGVDNQKKRSCTHTHTHIGMVVRHPTTPAQSYTIALPFSTKFPAARKFPDPPTEKEEEEERVLDGRHARGSVLRQKENVHIVVE